jgi:hypothetical protein
MCAAIDSLRSGSLSEWRLPFGFRSAYLVVSGVTNILFATAILWLPTQDMDGFNGLFAAFLAVGWFQVEMALLGIAVISLAVGLARRRIDPGVLLDWIGPPLCAALFIAFWFRVVVP